MRTVEQRSEHSGYPEPILLRPGAVLLDWLALNMRAPEVHAVGHPWQRPEPVTWDDTVDPNPALWRRYVTHPTTIRTSQFERVTYLDRTDGTKAATIWSEPHNGAMRGEGARWIQVQFANDTLHTGEWVGIFRMLRAYGCEFSSISRVDIAADGLEGDGGAFTEVVQGAVDGRWRYYGHGSWRPDMFRTKVTGFNFGSRSSNKFVRAYRKKRELKSKGEAKPWIAEAWLSAFGFDVMNTPGQEVNRFEIQLKGKELRRYFPEADTERFLERLSDYGQRVDVFASTAPSLFDFRTHAKYQRDAVPVCRWDWSGLGVVPDIRERATRSNGLSDHTIKLYLRSMWTVATVTSEPEGFRAAEALARSCGDAWVDWYQKAVRRWSSEYVRAEKAREGWGRTAQIFDALRNDRAMMEQWERDRATLRSIAEREGLPPE